MDGWMDKKLYPYGEIFSVGQWDPYWFLPKLNKFVTGLFLSICSLHGNVMLFDLLNGGGLFH